MYSITNGSDVVYGEVYTYRHFFLGVKEFSVNSGNFFPTEGDPDALHPFYISESSNDTIWFLPQKDWHMSCVDFVINGYTIIRHFPQAEWTRVSPIPNNSPDGPTTITYSLRTRQRTSARLLVAFTKEDITFFDGQDVSVEEFCIINPETLDFPSQWESEITRTYKLYKHLKGEQK